VIDLVKDRQKISLWQRFGYSVLNTGGISVIIALVVVLGMIGMAAFGEYFDDK
jgi:hypothetical protein